MQKLNVFKHYSNWNWIVLYNIIRYKRGYKVLFTVAYNGIITYNIIVANNTELFI